MKTAATWRVAFSVSDSSWSWKRHSSQARSASRGATCLLFDGHGRLMLRPESCTRSIVATLAATTRKSDNCSGSACDHSWVLELGSVLVPPAIPLVPPHMLAIVSFADEAAAQAASAALNGTNHAGRSLSVGGLAVEAFTQRQRFTKMFGRNAVATFERWRQVFEQT